MVHFRDRKKCRALESKRGDGLRYTGPHRVARACGQGQSAGAHQAAWHSGKVTLREKPGAGGRCRSGRCILGQGGCSPGGQGPHKPKSGRPVWVGRVTTAGDRRQSRPEQVALDGARREELCQPRSAPEPKLRGSQLSVSPRKEGHTTTDEAEVAA